jgi:hypothetical protein
MSKITKKSLYRNFLKKFLCIYTQAFMYSLCIAYNILYAGWFTKHVQTHFSLRYTLIQISIFWNF